MTLDVGFVILTMATLSFIGLGAQPPTPEWGAMVTQGRAYIISEWWMSTFPGLAIMISVIGFNLFGDGLREILDPKLHFGEVA
jgi:peptide/nickel transport system permease protein